MLHENVELLLQSYTETEEKQQHKRSKFPANGKACPQVAVGSRALALGQRCAAGVAVLSHHFCCTPRCQYVCRGESR